MEIEHFYYMCAFRSQCNCFKLTPICDNLFNKFVLSFLLFIFTVRKTFSLCANSENEFLNAFQSRHVI